MWPPVNPEVPPLDAEVGHPSLQPGPRPLTHLHHDGDDDDGGDDGADDDEDDEAL